METADCANVRKVPHYVVLCLSASLNISVDGAVFDILTRLTDKIHPSIFATSE